MSDRRRGTRLVIQSLTDGILRLMHDVYVESITDGRIVVDSEAPIPSGETLALELSRDLDARSLVPVEVASSTALATGGTRRCRLVLNLRHSDGGSLPIDPTQVAASRALARATIPAIGVLIRRVPVRVRDVSASGCQLESFNSLPEGAIGLLEPEGGDGHHPETLRVCRSRRVPGSARPWRSGARFLGLRAPLASSLRNLAARFEIADELQGQSYRWSGRLKTSR